MKIARRLDAAMADSDRCVTDTNCPAVFELENGDVAFIGASAPMDLTEHLPAGSGIGPGEHMVVVPRTVLVAAGWNVGTVRA